MIRTTLPFIALSVFFASYLWLANEITLDFWASDGAFSARSFPYISGTIGLVAALLLFARGLFTKKAHQGNDHAGAMHQPIWLMTVIIAIYIACIDWIGFLLASILFIIAGAYAIAPLPIVRLLPVAILVPTLLGGILRALNIYVPEGRLLQFVLTAL
ncbi:MAG: tripartite tricarboxylate transporter TctB family protein [Proteobacteria bacterium]|nr:tripartite tricarboxylate transporter TctB family protein [Pseudomonadota bacterium]